MTRLIWLLLAACIIAGFLGFWGAVGAFSTATIVIFWVALALLITTLLIAAVGGTTEAYR